MLPALDEEAELIVIAVQAAHSMSERLGCDIAIMQDLTIKPLRSVRYLEEGAPVEVIKHP